MTNELEDAFEDEESETSAESNFTPDDEAEEAEKGETEDKEESEESTEFDDTKDKDESEEESSDEESSEEETEESESEPPSEEKLVPVAAVQDARRKLQEANEKLARYEKSETDENAPDPSADPEAYEAYVEQRVEKKLLVSRIEKSQAEMLEKHEDWPEMEQIFMVLAGSNPDLYTEMNAAQSPAQFAYDKAKEYEKAQETKIRARIEAEVSEKDGADKKEPSTAEKRNKSALKSPKLNKVTSTNTESAREQLDSLEDMFEGAAF